jgi:hypothetical protein
MYALGRTSSLLTLKSSAERLHSVKNADKNPAWRARRLSTDLSGLG